MTDRISDHLNDDVNAEGAVPSESGAGGEGTPLLDPAVPAVAGQPTTHLAVDENEDDTANPI
jgi:hypothetical protein